MFRGHEFVKLLNDNWVLDLTEYKGYNVKQDKNSNELKYKLAFYVTTDEKNNITFDKLTRIPVKVLKEARNVVENNLKNYE